MSTARVGAERIDGNARCTHGAATFGRRDSRLRSCHRRHEEHSRRTHGRWSEPVHDAWQVNTMHLALAPDARFRFADLRKTVRMLGPAGPFSGVHAIPMRPMRFLDAGRCMST